MLKTPLYDEYARYGPKVVDFHGWALPVQFRGIVEEHLHTRAQAGVFDCSHMGEFLLRGRAALEAFDALVFSELHALKVGRCRYSAFLNDRGGIVDDCVFFKLDPETVYLVTNAGPLDTVAALLRDACPDVANVSETTVKIDVQGPASRQVLLDLEVEGIAGMKYWTGGKARWRGVEFIVTRAGYTGELGYELYLPAELGPDLWHALLAHAACMPCGLGARDTLRLETSKPLNGEDLGEDITPLEAGMSPLIQWNKDFRGRPALEALRDKGGYPVLSAIRSVDRRAPRHGFEIKREGIAVGRVSSGTFGPSLGCGVGLAYLPQPLAAPGNALVCGPRDLPILTAAMPLYDRGTCRMAFD